jgi:hypothetical protein
MQHLYVEGEVRLDFEEKAFFSKHYATMPLKKGLGYKQGQAGKFSPG